MCYHRNMNAKMIKEILQRAEGWPESAQADLAQAALEIESELQQGTYSATPEEVAAIERGLKEAAQGQFATEAEVEAVLVKYR
jgi:predicted transcriptional regulator